MFQPSPRTYGTHDRVIEEVAAEMPSMIVHTNVGGRHTVCLGSGPFTITPDVILCDQETLLVEHILEVETEETVSEEHVPRWRQVAHAARHRGKFWLLVPQAVAGRALLLCRQFNIPAHIAVWTLQPHGISINWPGHQAPQASPR